MSIGWMMVCVFVCVCVYFVNKECDFEYLMRGEGDSFVVVFLNFLSIFNENFPRLPRKNHGIVC